MKKNHDHSLSAPRWLPHGCDGPSIWYLLVVLTVLVSCEPPEIEIVELTPGFDQTPAIVSEPITFKNESKGEIDNYLWHFEDGLPSTSTEREPTVVFAADGIKKVSLTVSGRNIANTLEVGYNITRNINFKVTQSFTIAYPTLPTTPLVKYDGLPKLLEVSTMPDTGTWDQATSSYTVGQYTRSFYSQHLYNAVGFPEQKDTLHIANLFPGDDFVFDPQAYQQVGGKNFTLVNYAPTPRAFDGTSLMTTLKGGQENNAICYWTFPDEEIKEHATPTLTIGYSPLLISHFANDALPVRAASFSKLLLVAKTKIHSTKKTFPQRLVITLHSPNTPGDTPSRRNQVGLITIYNQTSGDLVGNPVTVDGNLFHFVSGASTEFAQFDFYPDNGRLPQEVDIKSLLFAIESFRQLPSNVFIGGVSLENDAQRGKVVLEIVDFNIEKTKN